MEERNETEGLSEMERDEWHREILLKRFGPASGRTAKVWREMVRAFGFDTIQKAEGFTKDQLNKKMQTTSFSQQLKEKFRQQHLKKGNF